MCMWVTECGGKHFVATIHAELGKTMDRKKSCSEENELIDVFAMK